MAPQNSSNKFIANLEKLLIGVLFASIIIFYFYTGQRELKEGPLFPFVLFLETLLLIYYIYQSQNYYSFFLIGFVLMNAGLYERRIDAEFGNYLILAGELAEFCFGLFLGYKTIQESKKNKDWEMFGTLVTIALMFPLIYRFALSGKELIMVYNFAFAFILGTIIYNENLWDKYNAFEKKILTYVLVSTVVEVLFISAKLL